MKKFLPVLLVVITVGGVYWFGTYQGKRAVQGEVDRLAPLVDMAVPKPAEVITVTNGSVTAVYGATAVLEIRDPEDYLPHTDGTLPKTAVRYVTITPQTMVVIQNSDGTTKPGTRDDVKAGTSITVRTNANIRTAEQFDATEVYVANY